MRFVTLAQGLGGERKERGLAPGEYREWLSSRTCTATTRTAMTGNWADASCWGAIRNLQSVRCDLGNASGGTRPANTGFASRRFRVGLAQGGAEGQRERVQDGHRRSDVRQSQ